MNKTITFDPSVYKLVPIISTTDMDRAADKAIENDDCSAEQVFTAMLAVVPAQLPGVVVHSGDTFQQRVNPWLLECFGAEISADKKERNHRFFEESAELVQACGMSRSEAHQLVDYVYGRPIGEPYQEVGGVMVTLAALCLANDMDMHQCGEAELARIWTKVEKIREKQAAKPKHSPLPEHVPSQPSAEALVQAALDAAKKAIWRSPSSTAASAHSIMAAIDKIDHQQIIESCKEKS